MGIHAGAEMSKSTDPGPPEWRVESIETPPADGLIVTPVLDWWRATTWTESLFQLWMITSPAKLLTVSRPPRCTGTVSSVCGADCRAGAACASVRASASVVVSILVVDAFCLLLSVLGGDPPPARCGSARFARSPRPQALSFRSHQCGRPTEKCELALPRVGEMVVQVHVRRIRGERLP